jgi:hypothetical protein
VSYEVQPTSNQRHAPNVFFERDAKMLEGNKIHDIIGELFVEWCAATLVIHTLYWLWVFGVQP